ncbi:MAG: carboxypeptidase-like regulatory domain-containing protein, partial [Prosthecobacter sp.]|nr:carboxypeptidase-like regulatory domain-containing protein [Prosthecobacter sp.]
MQRFKLLALILLVLIGAIIGFTQFSKSGRLNDDPSWLGRLSQMPDKVQEAKFMARYNTPMAFFGKVVDQYGNPIVNADVKLTVLDSPWKDSEPIKMVTDASGGFQLTSGRGRSLFVSIRKSGYDWSYRQDGKITSQKSFDYGGDSGDRIHRPDKANPVVFILRKPGVIQPLIIRPEFNFLLPDDGSVRRISLHPDHSPAHEISLSCKSDIGEVNAGEPYGWQFEISVPNGGLLERAVDSVYEAPEG